MKIPIPDSKADIGTVAASLPDFRSQFRAAQRTRLLMRQTACTRRFQLL